MNEHDKLSDMVGWWQKAAHQGFVLAQDALKKIDDNA